MERGEGQTNGVLFVCMKMAYVKEHTRGWCSPERYIQGPGEINNIEKYTKKFGNRVLTIIDQFFYQTLTIKLNQIYVSSGSEIKNLIFETEVTENQVAKSTEDARSFSPDIIVGIGGGKTLDISKAVSDNLGLPLMIVPTIASTDAPTSSLSVVYNEKGQHCGEKFYNHSPNIILVDSEIIAQAPVRFLVSGMGDALATLFEAKANIASDSPNLVYYIDGGFRRTRAAVKIAQACYDTLIDRGCLAKLAAEQHVVTEALEDIIETNILLSGLGFENNATAGAHSVADGITVLPEGSKTMHGEKVAFGTLCQLVIENASTDIIEEVIKFCLDVGLPVTLEDLNIKNTNENIRKIAEGSMHSNWGNEPFNVTEDMVTATIKVADMLGRKYKEDFKTKHNYDPQF